MKERTLKEEVFDFDKPVVVRPPKPPTIPVAEIADKKKTLELVLRIINEEGVSEDFVLLRERKDIR